MTPVRTTQGSHSGFIGGLEGCASRRSSREICRMLPKTLPNYNPLVDVFQLNY